MTTIHEARRRREREAIAFRDQIKQSLVTEEQRRAFAAEKFADGIRLFGAVYGERELISQLSTTLEVVRRLALRGPRADA